MSADRWIFQGAVEATAKVYENEKRDLIIEILLGGEMLTDVRVERSSKWAQFFKKALKDDS